MALYYYYAMLIVSLLILVVYVFIFHKHFDASITIMAVIIPVVNLGHLIIASSSVIEEALVGLRLSYIGGCFVTLAAMFLVFSICRVNIKSWIRAILVVMSSIIFISSLTIGHTSLFYKTTPTLSFTSDGVSYITDKNYGVVHTIFYIVVIAYYLATISVLIYCFFKKKQVSRKILVLVVLSVTIAFIGFFGGRLFVKWIGAPEIELLPLTYNLGMGLYLVIASRLRLYDASDSVTDSLVEKGETGFVSFDYKVRYLGSNDTAKRMFEEINHYVVDKEISDFPIGKEYILTLVESFKNDPSNNKCFVSLDNKTYLLQMNQLKVGRFYHGYQLLISDDTKNQEFIKLIQNYNSELEKEVQEKTQDILDLQNKLVLGMATMIEGRDNSTGGHIKRTSDCMRILIETMKEENFPGLTDKFCFNIVRAAPMHDLGKITIDDAILRKPGKFTDEEYAIMKTHSAEGARIIKEILYGTGDIEFLNIAVNVAHYHHERWDGSGYPDHLEGEEIPFEARIMAIADVYDALVSKRVYKEEFSFEEANQIIIDGFGKHFDPGLEKCYLAARRKIEEYYCQFKK
ncbi:MAG: HD domain-containing protein [Bacilli bacterium]|nr:HD domain-containing protein [Bacilli bacterium]